jgi:hypothetical protein
MGIYLYVSSSAKGYKFMTGLLERMYYNICIFIKKASNCASPYRY